VQLVGDHRRRSTEGNLRFNPDTKGIQETPLSAPSTHSCALCYWLAARCRRCQNAPRPTLWSLRKLQWQSRQKGSGTPPTVYSVEPGSSWLSRWDLLMLAQLPIEWLL